MVQGAGFTDSANTLNSLGEALRHAVERSRRRANHGVRATSRRLAVPRRRPALHSCGRIERLRDANAGKKCVAYASKVARHPGSPNCSVSTGALFSAGWPLAANRSIRVLTDLHIFSRPSRHGSKRGGPPAARWASSFGGSLSNRVILEVG